MTNPAPTPPILLRHGDSLAALGNPASPQLLHTRVGLLLQSPTQRVRPAGGDPPFDLKVPRSSDDQTTVAFTVLGGAADFSSAETAAAARRACARMTRTNECSVAILVLEDGLPDEAFQRVCDFQMDAYEDAAAAVAPAAATSGGVSSLRRLTILLAEDAAAAAECVQRFVHGLSADRRRRVHAQFEDSARRGNSGPAVAALLAAIPGTVSGAKFALETAPMLLDAYGSIAEVASVGEARLLAEMCIEAGDAAAVAVALGP